MLHYIVPFPASNSPFYSTPLSYCQRTYYEHTTRACFTRGCWLVITQIFGFRTLLTSQIIVPNKSPQCTNSIGKFESNFVPVFTIWIPTFWEISMQQWEELVSGKSTATPTKYDQLSMHGNQLIYFLIDCCLHYFKTSKKHFYNSFLIWYAGM